MVQAAVAALARLVVAMVLLGMPQVMEVPVGLPSFLAKAAQVALALAVSVVAAAAVAVFLIMVVMVAMRTLLAALEQVVVAVAALVVMIRHSMAGLVALVE